MDPLSEISEEFPSMRVNAILALLVGGVLGFVLGRATVETPKLPAPTRAAAAPARPPGNRPPPRVDDTTTVHRVPLENSPASGVATAQVTLVEFSDYQCPYCGRANQTVEQLEQEYGPRLRVVMKQFPLSFHPNARPAALAALAAGEQGKYWEMHRLLFANQQRLSATDMEGYARQLGLSIERWKADMARPELASRIEKEQALGSSLGVTGTPAFFINGRMLSGARPADQFKAIIDDELTKAQKLLSSGVKPDQIYAKLMETGVVGAPPRPVVVQKVDIPADSPFTGPRNAKVTVVEWSDFQCPYCGRALNTVKDLEQRYPNDVKIVFRHLPLPMHSNAQLAAEASMAAHEQGKFWAMHDKLFQNQQALDRASLERYAQEIGLNMGRFREALDSGKFRARVQQDASAASAVGVTGTPTFFVNGRQVVGAQPVDAFNVPAELARANRLLASGVRPEALYERLLAASAQ
jgi:protein-disulfide isomerase